MFGRIADSIRRFMVGRYGVDQLTIALVAAGLVISLLVSLLHWYWLYLLYWVIVFICLWRVLSRKVDKRWGENQKFMKLWSPIKQQLATLPKSMEQRKSYKLFACPHCGQKLRLPRGKGKVVVTCHRCSTQFEQKA